MSRRVLITDAQERAMVATARGLHEAGYRVTAAADVRPAAVHWSRLPSRRVRVPSPVDHPRAFVEALAEVVSSEEHAVLIPGGDASVLAVSAHRGLLAPPVRL